MEIHHQYVKLRKDFGRPAQLTDESAQMLADKRPNEELARAHVERPQVDKQVHVGSQMAEHEANTMTVVLEIRGMNHQEGGWPKEIDPFEAEQTIRYRRKVEKDEAYIKAVARMAAAAEAIIKSNNAIDIYEEYFEDMSLDFSVEPPSAKTLAVLRDPSSSRRTAQYIAWHPDGSRRLAAAYCSMEFQAQPPATARSSFLWDLANPNAPVMELLPASPLTCINYNLKDANLLGAGQYNGQFCYFDTRKGSCPVEATPIEHSHRDPIYDVAWLQSKTGAECMSVSSDGSVLWWDIRRLSEPTESLQIGENSDSALGPVSLECSPQAGPTKFLLGTEGAAILAGNRKAKTPADRISLTYTGHLGPVYALSRNPFAIKYFLSAGDWTSRIWNEDLKTPIITSPYAASPLTAAKWSPSRSEVQSWRRPGVYFTTRRDGRLEAWDFCAKQKEPSLSLQVTNAALASLRIQENGKVLAVGAGDGAVHILEASSSLSMIQPNEKAAIVAMFERESAREKNLEKAAKEAKIRARREAAKGAESGAAQPLSEADILKGIKAQIEQEFAEATGVALNSMEAA